MGDGTPASCTGQKVIDAVKGGGVVTFDCGADPIVIAVPEIRIFNNGGVKKDGSVTIEGGGKVTLDGGGDHRILYQNTCDESLVWTTPNCNTQQVPNLVLQNIGLTRGKGAATDERLGGGAIYVGGGTLKMINVRFFDNELANLKQDYAGGAVYAFNQTKPVYVVGSTFEGNRASSGGALGGIGTSWSIYNSVFKNNRTLGRGQNPAKPGTPGGGLGGAIYSDGNEIELSLCGTVVEANQAAELGSGSIFMVSNNLTGTLKTESTLFKGNDNEGAVQGTAHPSIYVEAKDKVGNDGVTMTTTTFQ